MAPTLSRKDSLDYLSEEKTPFVRERSSSQDSAMSAQPSQDGPQESQLVSRLINAAYIGLNTLSTVAIVFLNKIIFKDPQLKHCQVSTAMYHFTMTFLVLLACSSHPTYRLFNATRLPLTPLLPISLFFASSIVLSNLSLTFNSVGFFQLTKILTTPCVVLLQYLMFRITTNRMRLIAVGACCFGVAMTNTKQAITNPIGAIIATAAFSITALYQLYIGRQMKVLGASAPVLLLNQAPVSVVVLAFVMPWMDRMPDFATIPSSSVIAFLVSGLVAAMINYSQFMIIGRTSPLTFNIVGMAKITFVLVLSYFFEDASFSLIEVGGILLALSGTWLYGQYPDAKAVPTVVVASPSEVGDVERYREAEEEMSEMSELSLVSSSEEKPKETA